LSAEALQQEQIERETGEGSTFRAGSAAQSTVSVGVGEAGFGAALAYGDASRASSHYNVRRYTEPELDEEIARLRTVRDGYESNRRGWIRGVSTGQNEHDRMTTYTDRLAQLEAERARRDQLPAGDPSRVGGEQNLSDYPIVFQM